MNRYIQDYIDLVEQDKIRTCNEQKQLVAMVKKALQEEELKIDEVRLEKYMSYQQYFPFSSSGGVGTTSLHLPETVKPISFAQAKHCLKALS